VEAIICVVGDCSVINHSAILFCTAFHSASAPYDEFIPHLSPVHASRTTQLTEEEPGIIIIVLLIWRPLERELRAFWALNWVLIRGFANADIPPGHTEWQSYWYLVICIFPSSSYTQQKSLHLQTDTYCLPEKPMKSLYNCDSWDFGRGK